MRPLALGFVEAVTADTNLLQECLMSCDSGKEVLEAVLM